MLQEVSQVDVRVVNHGQSCCNRRACFVSSSNADTKQEIADDVCVCKVKDTTKPLCIKLGATWCFPSSDTASPPLADELVSYY